jgi:hypothetical protein
MTHAPVLQIACMTDDLDRGAAALSACHVDHLRS